MNWTGGALERSRGPSSSLTTIQKRHFAKVRGKQNLLNKPASTARLFGELEIPNLQTFRQSPPGKRSRKANSISTRGKKNSIKGSASHRSNPFRQKNKVDHSHSSQLNGPVRPISISSESDTSLEPDDGEGATTAKTMERPHEEMEVNIEAYRTRLLDTSDWVGLAHTKPAKVIFTNGRDRDQIGKRRRVKAAVLKEGSSFPIRVPYQKTKRSIRRKTRSHADLSLADVDVRIGSLVERSSNDIGSMSSIINTHRVSQISDELLDEDRAGGIERMPGMNETWAMSTQGRSSLHNEEIFGRREEEETHARPELEPKSLLHESQQLGSPSYNVPSEDSDHPIERLVDEAMSAIRGPLEELQRSEYFYNTDDVKPVNSASTTWEDRSILSPRHNPRDSSGEKSAGSMDNNLALELKVESCQEESKREPIKDFQTLGSDVAPKRQVSIKQSRAVCPSKILHHPQGPYESHTVSENEVAVDKTATESNEKRTRGRDSNFSPQMTIEGRICSSEVDENRSPVQIEQQVILPTQLFIDATAFPEPQQEAVLCQPDGTPLDLVDEEEALWRRFIFGDEDPNRDWIIDAFSEDREHTLHKSPMSSLQGNQTQPSMQVEVATSPVMKNAHLVKDLQMLSLSPLQREVSTEAQPTNSDRLIMTGENSDELLDEQQTSLESISSSMQEANHITQLDHDTILRNGPHFNLFSQQKGKLHDERNDSSPITSPSAQISSLTSHFTPADDVSRLALATNSSSSRRFGHNEPIIYFRRPAGFKGEEAHSLPEPVWLGKRVGNERSSKGRGEERGKDAGSQRRRKEKALGRTNKDYAIIEDVIENSDEV